MTNRKKGIRILGNQEWNLEELNDLLKFLQSDGGKKLIDDLNGLEASYRKMSESVMKSANMANSQETLYAILKNRDFSNLILTLLVKYFNGESVMQVYNHLYQSLEKQQEEEESDEYVQ